MTIEELIKKYSFTTLEENRIKVNKEVSPADILSFVKEYCDLQADEEEWNYYLDLKGVNQKALIEAIKYMLSREDLKDKLVILNIISLIKPCNSLDDEVFKSEDIYFNSLTEFLDFKLALNENLKEFCTTLSIYYVSLFKSYAKLEISFLDDARDMPSLYGTLIASLDFFTLGGIFSKARPFNTDACFVIKSAAAYVSNLADKNKITSSLYEAILADKKE